jgi:threonylcarbamoyladenosine tRNA methylthiotransferase MtaB
MSIAKIMEQAKQINQQGIKEIVLTGVNIGDFGKSTNETLYQLLVQLSKKRETKRVRISSIEPNLLTDEIIEIIAKSDNLMPHFHIPLQSGHDRILNKMGRRYQTETFKQRLDKVKSLIPDAGIAIDLITGFPGETETEFNKTVSFIDSLDIFYLHVFTYSDRENTKAWSMKNKVHPKEKERRSKILHELSEEKKKKFLNKQKDSVHKVLFEDNVKEDKMFGFTENYIKTESRYDASLTGKIKTVVLKEINRKGNMIVDIK